MRVAVQLYTQVEAFAAAISKLKEMGFSVNTEESELVYRGTAGAEGCRACQGGAEQLMLAARGTKISCWVQHQLSTPYQG